MGPGGLQTCTPFISTYHVEILRHPITPQGMPGRTAARPVPEQSRDGANGVLLSSFIQNLHRRAALIILEINVQSGS